MRRFSTLFLIFYVCTGGILHSQQIAEGEILDDFLTAASHTVMEALSGEGDATLQVEPLLVNGGPGFYSSYVGQRLEEALLSSARSSGIRIQSGNAADYRVQLSATAFPSSVSLMLRLMERENSLLLAVREYTYPRSEAWNQILMPGVSASGGSQMPDMLEPNDSISDASEIDLSRYQDQGLTLTPGNEDFFRFSVTEEQAQAGYELHVETRGSLDTTLSLYHESDPYSVMAENDDSGSDSNALIRVVLDRAGTYYLNVKGYSSDTEGIYDLFWDLKEPFKDEFEPDNDSSQASGFLPDNSVQNKNFSSSEDEDWVSLTIPGEAGSVQILTVETLGSQDTLLSLYDRNLELISYDDDSGQEGGNARIVQTVEGGALYYLKATPYSLDSGSSGEYGLTGSLRSVDTTADAYEDVDNSPATAPLIPVGKRLGGRSLSHEQDWDWFRFTLERPSWVILQTFGDTDTVMGLCASEGDSEDVIDNMLEEDDDSGDGYNARIRSYLPAGEYFAVVAYSGENYDYHEDYSYELKLELSQD